MRIVPTPIVLKTIDAHVRRYLPPPRSRNFPLLLAPLVDFNTTVPKLCSIINKWEFMVTYNSIIIAINLHININITYQYLFHFGVEDLTNDALLMMTLNLPLYFSDDEIIKLTTLILK